MYDWKEGETNYTLQYIPFLLLSTPLATHNYYFSKINILFTTYTKTEGWKGKKVWGEEREKKYLNAGLRAFHKQQRKRGRHKKASMEKVEWPQRKGLSSFVKASDTSSENSLDLFDSHTKPKPEEKVTNFKVPDWCVSFSLFYLLCVMCAGLHYHL